MGFCNKDNAQINEKINGLTLGALLFNSNKQIRSKPTITIYFRSKAIFDRYSIWLFAWIAHLTLCWFSSLVWSIIINGHSDFAKYAGELGVEKFIEIMSFVISNNAKVVIFSTSINLKMQLISICITLGVSTSHQYEMELRNNKNKKRFYLISTFIYFYASMPLTVYFNSFYQTGNVSTQFFPTSAFLEW